jgi:hypothetical protein
MAERTSNLRFSLGVQQRRLVGASQSRPESA